MTNISKQEKKKDSVTSGKDMADMLRTSSEQAEFMPVLEFEVEAIFLKGKAIIEVSIFANGDILAKLADTDITANGYSVEEAIASIKLEIEEEYQFFKEMEDCLSAHLKKQFEIVKRFFE